MRTVLVCVRTPLAAQTVASTAARLGMTGIVRTAVTENEAMLRLAERPAEIVLADTAVTRPDSVGFTRRVLARSPGAVIVLFGAEDPRVAAATVAAGARGVIRGAEHDLVSVVAKAILLLCLPARPAGAAGSQGQSATVASGLARTAAAGVRAALPRPEGAAVNGAPPAGPTRPGMPGQPGSGPPPAGGTAPNGQPLMVPAQRGDAGDGTGTDEAGAAGRPATADLPRAAGAGGRRLALTERELQVLRGMADGKSNAEIGRELFVSEDTVKTHARRLFRKLGARDRAHAVAAGFRIGLVA